MPACICQKEQAFASVHRASPQEVATAAAIGALFQWIVIGDVRLTPRETSAPGALALDLTRLLRDMAYQLTRRRNELSDVSIRIAFKNFTEDSDDVRRVLDRHFVSHWELLSTRRDVPDAAR
jgi:hypothetical protein